jgi:hypothetical protein
MPTKVSAQIDAVMFSLQAIERIGYHIPDWSALKIQALHECSLDVPHVSKRHATFNLMDVVRCVWYESNVYLFLLLYERFLIFFCLLVGFVLWSHVCFMCLEAHSHAIS